MFCISNSNHSNSGEEKSIYRNTNFHTITILVGGILLASGVALSAISNSFPLSMIGYILITVGLPFISYGLFLSLYYQCVLKEKKDVLDHASQQKSHSTTFQSKRTPISPPKRKSDSISTPKLNLQYLPFDQKMQDIYQNYSKLSETGLSKTADQITIEDFNQETALKGRDSQKLKYFAVKLNPKEVWIFRQNNENSDSATIRYTIKKGLLRTSISRDFPFSCSEKYLDKMKKKLGSLREEP